MNRHENSSIEILPQTLIDKIAAGEVVEGPLSVVKELCENALDAGATRIDITIEDAGFSTIRVQDNGSGMGPGDLTQAVLRHATSKLRSFDGLYSLSTMGFRGEALASIAAVSRCELFSAVDGNGGHRLKVEGGVVGEMVPAAGGRGTIISVYDLFYNTPARKKFVKSRTAERTRVVRMVEQLIIPFPAIHFTLTVEGKRVIEAPAVNNPRERIAQILGIDAAGKLVEARKQYDDISFLLLISLPQEARVRPRLQNLYVNLRRVENDAVSVGKELVIGKNAHVGQDAVCVGGNVIIKEGAVVEGEAVAVGGKVIADESAIIEGGKKSINIKISFFS